MNGQCNGTLYPRPARRAEHNDRNSSRLQILLILEAAVGGKENLETFPFRGVEQFAIFQRAPTTFKGRGHFVLRQELPQRCR